MTRRLFMRSFLLSVSRDECCKPWVSGKIANGEHDILHEISVYLGQNLESLRTSPRLD